MATLKLTVARLAPVLLAGLVSSLIVLPKLAGADETSDRREIIEDIEDELEEAADDLEDLHRESSASNVGSAIRHVENVVGLVEKLDKVKANDSTAKRMVDEYRNHARSFKDSAAYLAKSKEKQKSLDTLPAYCQKLDKDLEQRISTFVDRKDPLGMEELPKLGESLRRNVDDKWKDAENTRRDMEQWRSATKNFSVSEAKWSDVKNKLHSSADGIYGEWEKDWNQAAASCKDLKQGGRHPKIEKGMVDLAQFSKGRDEIVREMEKLIDEAASLLSGADKDADDSDISKALQKAADLESTLTRLGYAKGEDAKAKEMVEKWPRFIEAYRFSLKQVIELKKWQYTLDKAAPTCKARESDLVSTIDAQKDATGIVIIEAKAKELQTLTRSALDKAHEQNKSMEQWNENAQKLSISDGKWSYLSGYARGTAKGIFDYWYGALEDADDACGDLVKGHPRVERAISSLRKTIPQRADHKDKHDSNCTGVPPGGFCTTDDQCLDNKCTNNKCESCPSRGGASCHPPGTCDWSTFKSRMEGKDRECDKERSAGELNAAGRVDCRALEQRCNAADACVLNRLEVYKCFRGGDDRHMDELNIARTVAEKCNEVLKKKRSRDECL